MSGIELARELAMLGAETAVTAPRDDFAFRESGPTAFRDRWEELGRRMREHESDDDPILQVLCGTHELGHADYWLFMLCVAVERYQEAAAAMSFVNDDAQIKLVTPMGYAQLMHAAVGEPVERSLCGALNGGEPAGLGLLQAFDPPAGRPTTVQPLRVVLRELTAILEGDHLSRSQVPAGFETSLRTHFNAYDLDQVKLGAALTETQNLLLLRCSSPRAGRQFALDLAAYWQLDAKILKANGTLPPLSALRRVRDALPILDLTEFKLSDARSDLHKLRSERNRVIVLLQESESVTEFSSFRVPPVGRKESERIWSVLVGEGKIASSLARCFRLSYPEAVEAVNRASELQVARGDPQPQVDAKLIAEQVLSEGRRRMGKLVTCLETRANLSDLVVPDSLRDQLGDIVDWYGSSDRVYDEMGLSSTTTLGRGLTCLCSGPPGTGKTFAAQCLANSLGLNLYRIDLSQVVSKYIGETEKALSATFDEAEAGHGLLLFDEADALFGKRSEVKDAHDRYANIEVGYLLQRLEAFEGVAILATNLRSNMDAAFLRRINFILEFPMPDATMRRQLWEQSLPHSRYRSDELDLDVFVQRFRLSGGNIRNVGIAAAHMAAATPECRISMAQLVRATYRELEKTGQNHSSASFGELAEFLPREARS